MTRYATLPAALGIFAASAPVGAGAATVTTLSSDFEQPAFVAGNITNDPNVTGQGGWGGWNAVIEDGQLVRARVVDDRAYSGTQSLRTTSDTRVIAKALDAEGTAPYNTDSTGEYPFHSGGFCLYPLYDWWVQTRVWINPGGSARFTLFNGLGGCPVLDIGNFGAGNDPGEPYANTCLANSGDQVNLGPSAYGQWLLLEMVHTTDMFTPNGWAMEFRITGDGISRTIQLAPYSGPGSGNPAYVGLAGDAWWDDVRAGYGEAPAPPVPLPGAAWLLASSLGVLSYIRRRYA
jgi:hypothetical protein